MHTLSVGMFLGSEEVWWFGDVGYRHDNCVWCPSLSRSAASTSASASSSLGGRGIGGNMTGGIQGRGVLGSGTQGAEDGGVEGGKMVRARGRCECNATGIDENFYKLVPLESPQRKPRDTCIRQWLGGKWLETRRGWTAEGERAFGGDGWGGYVYS